ncbi:hypothetical protein HOLleu_40055 [Holothuria leucospilota]|uniref:Nucleic-acid-binding protein from transposon X-element n=1 Tax=Holothuria leucospilota TaxID=206669 RepID=A0A9Q0YH85_HOLLE|nr:hypothetical protein HOLleu_40055 [Holothuria leucospilota]
MDTPNRPQTNPQPNKDNEGFIPVTNKRQLSSPTAPDTKRQKETTDSNSYQADFPVLLIGLPPSLKNNPIQLRKYAEQNHPAAIITRTRLTRNGHLLLHAKDKSSQSQLLQPWTPTDNYKPFPRLPTPPPTPTYQAVITKISPDIDDNTILNEIQTLYHVTAVRRFTLKGTSTPIWKVAATFKTEEDMEHALAHGIFIGHQLFNLQRITSQPPTPPQCHKCQRWGHTALNCRSKTPTCLRCAGKHTLNDCPTPKDTPTCANCKKPHIASYKGCSTYKKATAPPSKQHHSTTPGKTTYADVTKPVQASATASAPAPVPAKPVKDTSLTDVLEQINKNHTTLENKIDASTRKHNKDLMDLTELHNRHTKDLKDLKALHTRHDRDIKELKDIPLKLDLLLKETKELKKQADLNSELIKKIPAFVADCLTCLLKNVKHMPTADSIYDTVATKAHVQLKLPTTKEDLKKDIRAAYV